MDLRLSLGPQHPVASRQSSSAVSVDIRAGLREALHWSPWLTFGALAVFALALRLACATGFIGSDDLNYVSYARALMEGHYTEALDEARSFERIHRALRYGVLIPLAGLYKVFGVTEWTTIALPLAASTASVLLLAEIGRRLFDMRVAIIAGLLYATFPLQLRLGTILLPEPIAECFALFGVLCYLHARHQGGALWVAAGALMGSAYLAKESALFIGGAFFLHTVWERRWRGGMLFALGLAGVIAVEHGYYFFGQGDILFRSHSTQFFNLQDPENLRNLNQDLIYRLFRKYPHAMLVPNLTFGLHSLACLVWAAAALALKPRRGYAFVLLWTAIPWLYLNFGSWSFERYALLPRDPRYIEFMYPPLMLLSGVALSRALAARAMIARPMAAVLGLVLLVGVASGLATRGRTAKAEEMTVLREIVRATQAAPAQTIYTDDRNWRRALDVFDPSLVSASPDTATFILARDPLGLPAVQRPPSAPRNELGSR